MKVHQMKPEYEHQAFQPADGLIRNGGGELEEDGVLALQAAEVG